MRIYVQAYSTDVTDWTTRGMLNCVSENTKYVYNMLYNTCIYTCQSREYNTRMCNFLT